MQDQSSGDAPVKSMGDSVTRCGALTHPPTPRPAWPCSRDRWQRARDRAAFRLMALGLTSNGHLSAHAY